MQSHLAEPFEPTVFNFKVRLEAARAAHRALNLTRLETAFASLALLDLTEYGAAGEIVATFTHPNLQHPTVGWKFSSY